MGKTIQNMMQDTNFSQKQPADSADDIPTLSVCDSKELLCYIKLVQMIDQMIVSRKLKTVTTVDDLILDEMARAVDQWMCANYEPSQFSRQFVIATFLNNNAVCNLLGRIIAKSLEGKSTEQLRMLFQQPNDLSETEVAQIQKENNWIKKCHNAFTSINGCERCAFDTTYCSGQQPSGTSISSLIDDDAEMDYDIE